MTKGFTLIEIAIILAISGILLGLTIKSFTNLGSSRALESNASLVVSVLNQARVLTLASKDNTQYGVHLESSQVVLFKGLVYVSSNPNNVFVELNNQASVSAVNIAGGGNDVLFERLTGKTAQNGAITLALVSDPTRTKSINIYLTGLIESN